MKISNDPTKYTYAWRHVELARHVPSLNRIIREKVDGIPILLDVDHLSKYVKKHNNIGIYTSIWHYNDQDIEKSTRLGSLYFDIDNEDVNISLSECRTLYNYLIKYIPQESIVVYYTGKKGFHIECEAIALGINPSNSLHRTFRFIADDLSKQLNLTSLDFSVYDQRRMWRLPGSKHQETGLYKTKLPTEIINSDIQTIIEYCSTPKDNTVSDQEFSYTANEWYREYSYKMEEEKNKPKDILAYFNQYGSKSRIDLQDSQKVFDKNRLLSNCSAFQRIEKEAKEKNHLDHESRLFLCSILTYTDDAILYLNQILSHCEDYNPKKSSAHINDWIKRREIGIGGRPYTCERANAAGVGCGDCSLEHNKKWVKIGEKYVETDEKVSPSPIRFAYNVVKKGGENKDD
jgi:hypothetical protein